MYYSAQLGLDLKSHGAGSREYLLSLITLLEKVRQTFLSHLCILDAFAKPLGPFDT